MPIYEYRCEKCGDVFDLKQSFADEPITRHEGCGGAVERLISAPTFQFKGTGWYVTDYARGGDKNGKSTDNDASGKDKESSAKKESSGDTKPADSGATASTPTEKK